MTAVEIVIEIAKYTHDINEVTVMSGIAEYRLKQIIWIAVSKISPTTWRKNYCSARELTI